MHRKSGHSANSFDKLTFKELLHERPLRPYLRRKQDTQDVWLLRPRIHRLLIRLPALLKEDVDDARVGHVPVALKLGAHRPPDVVRGHVQPKGYTDLGRLDKALMSGESDVEGR